MINRESFKCQRVTNLYKLISIHFKGVHKAIDCRHIHPHVSQYLLKTPLADSTALSLWIYMSVSAFWKLNFPHSSLQNLYSSHVTTGLRPGLWLGHSKIFTLLFWSHFCVALTLCLKSLLCWNINLFPSHSPLAGYSRFLCILQSSTALVSVLHCLYAPGVSLPDWVFCLQPDDSHVYVQRVLGYWKHQRIDWVYPQNLGKRKFRRMKD